jgi:hypothetical protein
MAFLYLAGEAANFILASTLSSTSADANFLLTNLNNSRQWKSFRFGSAGTDDTLTADLGSSLAITFCSVHFHNIDSGVTAVQLRKSTDNFAANDVLVSAMTVSSPSFFLDFASASTRYVRLKFVGTNTGGPIEIGKWVVGARSSLTRVQKNDWELGRIQDQVRNGDSIINRALYPRRSLALDFAPYTAAQIAEIQALLDSSLWGQEPVVVAPDSSAADVLYGRTAGEWSYRKSTIVGDSLREHRLEIQEDQFPYSTT